MTFEQPFVQELPVELIDLRGVHLAAIGCELPVGVRADRDQFAFRRRRIQRGVKFFLQHRKTPFDLFEMKAARGAFLDRTHDRQQRIGGFVRHSLGLTLQFRGSHQCGIVSQISTQLRRIQSTLRVFFLTLAPDCSLLHLFGCAKHLLRTERETVYLARPGPTSIVTIEC